MRSIDVFDDVYLSERPACIKAVLYNEYSVEMKIETQWKNPKKNHHSINEGHIGL